VAKVYSALAHSPQWQSTMLVVVYDEHGGFYDHVDPLTMPAEFRARAEFGGDAGGLFGPRVPAMVVSPLVERGAAFGSSQADDPTLLFDHTALIRTILLRFAGGSTEGLDARPAARIESSSHLGHVLTNTGAPRLAPDIPPRPQLESVADWWAERIEYRLKYPMAESPALRELGVVEGPTGTSALAGEGLSLLGRIKDFFRRLFGGGDRAHATTEAAAADPEPPPEGVGPPAAVVTEVSELQQGIAAAAKVLREDHKLPGGQP
jgi:hypothetical protein